MRPGRARPGLWGGRQARVTFQSTLPTTWTSSAEQRAAWLKPGHCGPFVAHRHRCASLPEEIAPEALTLEQALGLPVRAHGAGPKRGGRSGRGDEKAVFVQ